MANEQVLTAEQVLEKASQYLADEDIELVAVHMNMPRSTSGNNIENRVNHILFTQFKLQVF